MRKNLRALWHDLYYKLASPRAVDFALTCKHAVEYMELKNDKKTWRVWLKLSLHLSLCRVCGFYYRTSRVLGKAVKDKFQRRTASIDVAGLNQQLLKKYTDSKKQ